MLCIIQNKDGILSPEILLQEFQVCNLHMLESKGRVNAYSPVGCYYFPASHSDNKPLQSACSLLNNHF